MMTSCFGTWGQGAMWPMMGSGGGFGGIGIFGAVISLIFWVVIIIGIVYLVKHLVRGRYYEHDDAAEILKKRYAKGEITKEDYDKMKKELEKM